MTARITRPGVTDLHWMVVVCTPEGTTVDFAESEDEARGLASANISPGVTTYYGQIVGQGADSERGKVRHLAIPIIIPTDRLGALSGRRRSASVKAFVSSVQEFVLAQVDGVGGWRR